MNYWLTTCWPAVRGRTPQTALGVFLEAGKQEAAKDMRPGDLVLIYEFKSAPPELRRDGQGGRPLADRWPGREGIVVVAKAVGRPKTPEEVPTLHVGRDPACWIRIVDMRLPNYNGFVPRDEVIRILGFKRGSRLWGIGRKHSGLYRLGEEQFNQLLRLFKGRQPVSPATV
jgi:hypothetical protein